MAARGMSPQQGSAGVAEQLEMALSDREFDRLRQRVHRVAGIAMSDAKRTLVVSRLAKIVRRLGLDSFDAYIDHLDREGTAQDQQEFVNALTTNLTRFFREDHHFDHLATYVERLVAARRGAAQPRLRVWSAGCSTGQEPYTIALMLADRFPELKRWDFRILATDIDTSVVEKARAGRYPASELSGLPAARAALFERGADGGVVIPAAARQLVTFKPLNLMGEWPMKGPFDAIFCRNVAIYFDKPTQARLFERFSRLIAREGFLYIGHSENIAARDVGFRLVGKTIYQAADGQKTRSAA